MKNTQRKTHEKNDKNFCAEFNIFVCISLFFVHFSNDFFSCIFQFFHVFHVFLCVFHISPYDSAKI